MAKLGAAFGQARDDFKKKLITGADKLGYRVLDDRTMSTKETESELREAAQFFKSGLKAFTFGGKVGAPDEVQIVVLEKDGLRHVYVQPYGQVSPLPGEHHAVLPGSIAAPAAFVKQGLFGRKRWIAGDEAIAAHLNAQQALTLAAKRCKWTWQLLSTSTIKLGWTAQARSLGDGRVHLVVSGGQYHAIFKNLYDYGYGRLHAVAGALQPALGRDPAPPQTFLNPTPFDDGCVALLDADWSGAPAAGAPPTEPKPA